MVGSLGEPRKFRVVVGLGYLVKDWAIWWSNDNRVSKVQVLRLKTLDLTLDLTLTLDLDFRLTILE